MIIYWLKNNDSLQFLPFEKNKYILNLASHLTVHSFTVIRFDFKVKYSIIWISFLLYKFFFLIFFLNKLNQKKNKRRLLFCLYLSIYTIT